MFSHRIYTDMLRGKLAVVIRGADKEEAVRTAEACYAGGIRLLEMAFTNPDAPDIIREVKRRFPKAVVGAGTVLDSETAAQAVAAGAQFIVSPSFQEASARFCHRYDIPYLPGCMTIQEMVTAMEHGVKVVKLFPGSAFTPDFIKNVKQPLPQVSIMPTGGITLENVNDWFAAGAVLAGVGGDITRGAGDGDFAAVRTKAEAFVKQVHG
ncbi:bifunctional 2-keto-4-hydroxyglutarate aldolase/2-keto-3-deoxy-6-phosphogluconate aldolase [Alkalicoccus urumqiensis]|uniref:Bifunctional 2-keto-4-hydroxyglutarate aldolase/2-keto-3-deoxy-6-phosphogluconate aldolase n=1 Tax=Alkalicoccus urumqiensis TaxID=1548213 RepID=A0A2P6MJN4_ALKUR|nr:bifunctional 2-keto-4-hydroxyglutarate aldolase/2-keto-3-deoxy-6-phosphogluconate aldolase [Alkalicoccus urumqiensis]PRO66498.1 bifunctional 2-keto-4-hydroxyglutarate aldolase/2-keto-3-deoxy-6-phosphogluconate aldolase [Alkalicoccus urumqiensis]